MAEKIVVPSGVENVVLKTSDFPTRAQRRAALLAQIETTKKCPESVERDLYLRVLHLERELVDAHQICDHFMWRRERLRQALILDGCSEEAVAAIEADHRVEGELPVCDPVSIRKAAFLEAAKKIRDLFRGPEARWTSVSLAHALETLEKEATS